MKKSMKFATALAGAAVVVVGGTAFTAANTVPETYLGAGSATVSGVVITGIEYTLAADPTDVDGAVFTTTDDLASLDPDPTVESNLTLSAGGPVVGTCVVTDATTLTCEYADTELALVTGITLKVY